MGLIMPDPHMTFSQGKKLQEQINGLTENYQVQQKDLVDLFEELRELEDLELDYMVQEEEKEKTLMKMDTYIYRLKRRMAQQEHNMGKTWVVFGISFSLLLALELFHIIFG